MERHDHTLVIILRTLEALVSAIDDLNNNINQLKVDVEALIALPKGVPEAEVAAAATAVASLDAEVKAALPPA